MRGSTAATLRRLLRVLFVRLHQVPIASMTSHSVVFQFFCGFSQITGPSTGDSTGFSTGLLTGLYAGLLRGQPARSVVNALFKGRFRTPFRTVSKIEMCAAAERPTEVSQSIRHQQ